MHLSPPQDDFKVVYESGTPQVIYHKLVTDTETPITASLKLMAENKPYFLLESVENATNRGRYSIIGMAPDLMFKCDEQHAYISMDGADYVKQAEPPIEALRLLHRQCQFPLPAELPPMASGLIGYISYDAIRYIETTVPDTNPDSIGIPIGMFMRPTLMIIFDSVSSSIYIVRTIYPKDEVTAGQAYLLAAGDVLRVLNQLQQPLPQSSPAPSSAHKVTIKPHMSKEAFKDIVEQAKSYIYDGDIFQIVPSQRFSTSFTLPPFALYRSLRHLNPSPFLFFLDFCQFQLVGSSPEILARLRDGKVTIRPLAGTRKRGQTKEEDAALAAELLADEKEIAEHLMLIDLSRNDVGKVSKPGTVKLTEQMVIEYYSHVMHISSNVEGEIDPQYDALNVLFSALPVGTVSGAPKVRAMQIIDELESEKRSFYAGCVGYFSANGSMDTCITLRTGLIKDKTLYLQAGCGVVADSVPETEYEETINKAKALVKAAEAAADFV